MSLDKCKARDKIKECFTLVYWMLYVGNFWICEDCEGSFLLYMHGDGSFKIFGGQNEERVNIFT